MAAGSNIYQPPKVSSSKEGYNREELRATFEKGDRSCSCKKEEKLLRIFNPLLFHFQLFYSLFYFEIMDELISGFVNKLAMLIS